MVTITAGIMFFLLTCIYFPVWGILRLWSAFAKTAYEVVRGCINFEKHWDGNASDTLILW
jgi:hypothetical protein